MRKLLIILTVAIVFVSCQKEETGKDVVGN